MARQTPQRKVRILIFDRCNIVDATGPAAVFGAANEVSGESRRLYDIDFIAPAAGPVETTAGPALYAPQDVWKLRGKSDVLVCAGGQGVQAIAHDEALLRRLRTLARSSSRVVSVCTGAFLLAAAGLLDGRRAVTHWNHCAELASRFPSVTVDPNPIFIRDGEIYTSAGVTAGMDLALALVEQDFGRDLALLTARELVMYMKRPGNQAQFSVQLSAQMATDDRLRDLQLWMLDHIDEELTIDTLAARAAMSPRTLHRRFKEATGHSPARFISCCRVESARRLLEESALPIKAIALRCGFSDEERMRRSFHRILGVGPDAYRARFTTTDPLTL